MDTNIGSAGLVRLSPFSGDVGGPLLYFRIFGHETTLTYVKELLERPETAKRLKGYDHQFSTDLEQVIEILQDEKVVHAPGMMHRWEAYVTVRNYATRKGQETSIPDLRNRLQQYQLLYKNASKNITLTENELRVRDEFISMLEFFIDLEQRYDEWRFHQSGLDDE
jgi:hypothetical protein